MPRKKPMPLKEIADSETGKQVLSKMTALATAAFGLVAALAWNSAVQAIFDNYYPTAKEGILPKVIYAITVTIMAVFIMIWLGKLAEKRK